MTSSLLCHRKRHQNNVTKFFNFESLHIKISGYTPVAGSSNPRPANFYTVL